MHDDHHDDPIVPKEALIAAAALMVASVVLAGWGRLARGDAEDTSVFTSADTVVLRFEDRPDGSVSVVEAESDAAVLDLPPGSDGFVRGVMRGLFRTRMLESVPRDAPFLLARGPDGTLAIRDPETGHQVDLGAFGRTNYESFARLHRVAQEARR